MKIKLPLQTLIGNHYSILLEIFLWLFPIGGGFAGYYLAGLIFGKRLFHLQNATTEQHVKGVLIGILVGIILDILYLGPKILLLDIRSGEKKR
jgi:hypothetical protein